MMRNRNLKFISLLCCFLVANAITANSAAEDYFILRNPKSQLVLDGSEDFVKLQTFTGFSTQLWTLEPVRGGSYFIVNKKERKVLDIDYRNPIDNTRVVLNKRIEFPASSCVANGTMLSDVCQKWFIHYGNYIVNACAKVTIDIPGGNYSPGVQIKTWKFTESVNQQFHLQYE